MAVVAIITARGGSKRIPRKNIKDFMGKPMLSYAIDAAIRSEIFDEVMVSTDDKEIAQIAVKYGAKVPFMRSCETSNDYATTLDVLAEVIYNYKKINKKFDDICCIYPCVPFLTANILKDAYKQYKDSNADGLIPVVNFSYPIQRAYRINQEGYLAFREPENERARSQDLETMYHDVGMFYFYKDLSNIKKILPYKMKESNIQDIDTLEDWKMAEIKYSLLNN